MKTMLTMHVPSILCFRTIRKWAVNMDFHVNTSKIVTNAPEQNNFQQISGKCFWVMEQCICGDFNTLLLQIGNGTKSQEKIVLGIDCPGHVYGGLPVVKRNFNFILTLYLLEEVNLNTRWTTRPHFLNLKKKFLFSSPTVNRVTMPQ